MHPILHANDQQQKRVSQHVANADSYAFFNLLTGPQLLDKVESLLPEHHERQFPPTETLSMFLAQALSANGSCRAVVNDAAVKRLVSGMTPCSTNTSGYCRARARLPQAMIATLSWQAGEVIAAGAAAWWHWRGRPVRLVDSATVTLPDTEENQAKYPQSSSQKPGGRSWSSRLSARRRRPKPLSRRCIAAVGT